MVWDIKKAKKEKNLSKSKLEDIFVKKHDSSNYENNNTNNDFSMRNVFSSHSNPNDLDAKRNDPYMHKVNHINHSYFANRNYVRYDLNRNHFKQLSYENRYYNRNSYRNHYDHCFYVNNDYKREFYYRSHSYLANINQYRNVLSRFANNNFRKFYQNLLIYGFLRI